MGMKIGTPLAMIAFAITMAYYVSNRLSPDALTFAVGVLSGIAASVPVSLGLLIALGRRRELSGEAPSIEYHQRTPEYRTTPAPMPQVIVIPPPQGQHGPPAGAFGFPGAGGIPYPAYTSAQSEYMLDGRDWKIIGQDQ
jgi:hypothetical protein